MNKIALLLLPASLLAISAACGGSDNGLSNLCGTPQLGFDIEEASVLEDAQGYRNMHDAIILDYDASQLAVGAAWRVRSVEIMPLMGEFSQSFVADGTRVTVEVWDADNPNGVPWTVTQVFNKGEHEWTPVTLQNASTTFEPQQLQTWWRFGFEDVIPTTGMTSGRYLVGVAWDSSASPTLGYSNFNRDCSSNWTDYDDDRGWVLNDVTSSNGCSWPMLKVNLEILERSASCENGSVPVE